MYNILFLISNLEAGGAQRVISELSNKMVEKGIKISIALLYNDVIYYSLNNEIQIYKYYKSKKNKIEEQKRKLRFIQQSVEDSDADIVISFLAEVNIYASIALWNYKVKLIISERNDPQREPASLIKKILRKFVYKRPDGFVFQTKQSQKFFGKRIQSHSVVIHNPVKDGLPNSQVISKDYYKIVSIGRLENQKNYPLALKVIKSLIEAGISVKYYIYGQGSCKFSLQKLCSNLGIEQYVYFMGTSKNVHTEIIDTDFFLMTSNYEGLPNVLLEAMSMGLVVLATNCPCGGPSELIQHGVNGFLFPVGDDRKAVETIISLISDKGLCLDVAIEAKKIRDTHDLNRITEEWINYIDEVKKGNSNYDI